MSTRRKNIRKAIINLLMGRTEAGENVRSNRGEVNWEENLPAVNLYFRGEETDKEASQAPRMLRRVITFEAELLAKGEDGTDISDRLDDLCEEVEIYLSVDDSLQKTADDITLTRVSEMETTGDGAIIMGKISLFFEVVYHEYSPRDQKGQGVGDFDGINAQWQVGHDDDAPTMVEADRAKDTIDYP